MSAVFPTEDAKRIDMGVDNAAAGNKSILRVQNLIVSFDGFRAVDDLSLSIEQNELRVIIGPNAGTDGSGALFETIRKGFKFYTNGSMGFVDVTDVAKCMIALMNSDIHSERFIINAENRDYKNLTAEIAQCFDMKPPAILAKPWMMELAWRGAAFWGVVTGSAPAIDKTSAQAASINRNFDNGKIKKAIGIEFKPVSESIKEVCTALTAK